MLFSLISTIIDRRVYLMFVSAPFMMVGYISEFLVFETGTDYMLTPAESSLQQMIRMHATAPRF